MTVSLVFTLH